MTLRHYIEHTRNCRAMRRLFKGRNTPNLKNLYWYDFRLFDAIRPLGIFKVILKGLFGRKGDEIAANYGLINLYYGDPIGDGLEQSGATVWNCKGLNSQPWFDQANAVTKSLEHNAETVIAEYRALADRIGTHPDNASLTDRGKWTGSFLYGAKGAKNEAFCQYCPETTRIVETLPLCKNFGFVMFSGVEPHSHITPHCGSSNLRLRHHLGVDVPEPDAARIRVGTQWRHWAEGKAMAFDDSFEHEVIHDGELARAVLSVDVWHPSLTEEEIQVLSDPLFQRFGKLAA